jgi:hypothetical protein
MTVHESVKRESLKPLSRMGPVVSSTLDLETVLTTVVARATQLAGADAALISSTTSGAKSFVPGRPTTRSRRS